MRWFIPYAQWFLGYSAGGFAIYAGMIDEHKWPSIAFGFVTAFIVVIIDRLRQKGHPDV